MWVYRPSVLVDHVISGVRGDFPNVSPELFVSPLSQSAASMPIALAVVVKARIGPPLLMEAQVRP